MLRWFRNRASRHDEPEVQRIYESAKDLNPDQRRVYAHEYVRDLMVDKAPPEFHDAIKGIAISDSPDASDPGDDDPGDDPLADIMRDKLIRFGYDPAALPVSTMSFNDLNDLYQRHMETYQGDQFSSDPLDVHFHHSQQIRDLTTKGWSSDPVRVEEVRQACISQIDVSDAAAARFRNSIYGDGDDHLPTHLGYERLAIDAEKANDFSGAIALSRKAQAQGWNGDWEKRIARCERKLHKQLGGA